MRGFPLQDEGPGMNQLFHDLSVEQERAKDLERLGHRINYGRLYPGKTYKADCSCGWSCEGERSEVYSAVHGHEEQFL